MAPFTPYRHCKGFCPLYSAASVISVKNDISVKKANRGRERKPGAEKGNGAGWLGVAQPGTATLRPRLQCLRREAQNHPNTSPSQSNCRCSDLRRCSQLCDQNCRVPPADKGVTASAINQGRSQGLGCDRGNGRGQAKGDVMACTARYSTVWPRRGVP